MSSATVTIRRADAADSPALSHICLVTADAGVSAASLHGAGELPGLMYAEQYVHLPEGFGFVLEDSARRDAGDPFRGVVGYVLSTWDTRAFEKSKTYNILAIEMKIELWAKYIPGQILQSCENG